MFHIAKSLDNKPIDDINMNMINRKPINIFKNNHGTI